MIELKKYSLDQLQAMKDILDEFYLRKCSFDRRNTSNHIDLLTEIDEAINKEDKAIHEEFVGKHQEGNKQEDK